MFTGAVCAVTTAVWSDWALDEPSAFVAVSSTRSVEPTSPGATTWVCPVSPAIAAQPAPTASQRSHASAKPIGGVPVQEPETAVSVSPETAVPLMVGGDALDGVAAERASAPALRAAMAAAPTTSAPLDLNAKRRARRTLSGRCGSDMVDSLLARDFSPDVHARCVSHPLVRARGPSIS